MIDANFGDTFLFNGRMRPEAVLGIGVQKRIMRAGPLAIEVGLTCSATSLNDNQGENLTKTSHMPISPNRALEKGSLGSGRAFGYNPG